MPKFTQPLAEVFGYLPTDFSAKASSGRDKKLCPFNNRVARCTKDKAEDPLGVCSINYAESPAITCPVRFRENWLVVYDAAKFFFPPRAEWAFLTEVRLVDKHGKSAGNIDMTLVAHDENGKVYDFGSLEIQAVYISGNIREPFSHYMADCQTNAEMNWISEPNFPRPDFLSSSRKRLVPQLLYKGGILHEWNKKMAVALDVNFFNTLPQLQEVEKTEAEIVWLVYDLELNDEGPRYTLRRVKTVYTKFLESLNMITRPSVGKVENFLGFLQQKVDEKLKSDNN